MTLHVRMVMKSSSNQRNQKALQHFLEELMCEARRPEEIELLAEILESLQQAPRWTLPSKCKVREGMTP
jgi:hypothetical protein